jgi:hypothetical protein
VCWPIATFVWKLSVKLILMWPCIISTTMWATNKMQQLPFIGLCNPLNAQLNPICPLLALLGAHHIFHVSRIRVKSALHISGYNFAHPQEHFHCIYSFWYNAPTPCHRSAALSGHCTESCIYSGSAPEDGRNFRPKHIELILKNTNKR